MMKKYRFEILLFLAYLLLAIAFTWPMAAKINSSIYGLWGDHFSQLWSDWWREEALFSGKSLFCTPLLDAPFGFCYKAVGFEPLRFGLRFALTLLTNEVLSLNIWLILSFPLSGLAVYLLVKHLTKNKLAGAFSGLVYAFSMYRFSHAWEHSSLVFTFWMPFYVWALVRFDEEKNFKRAMVAALLFSAVLLDNLYYGYFIIFFTVFFFIFRLRGWLNWRSLRFAVLLTLLCVLFSAPFLFPTLQTFLSGNTGGELAQEAYQRSLHDVNWLSARPWYYILPSPWHPLWGKYSRRVLDWIATKPPYFLTQQYDGNEHNLYLGWVALILSGVAVIKGPALKTLSPPNSPARRVDDETRRVFLRRRSTAHIRLFLFLGITMAVFSAPPMATLAGLKIYFPSHYLYNFFPMFRAYARFGVLVLLCVAVLAGFGLDHVLSVAARFYRARERQHKVLQLQYLVVSILSGIVLLEVLLPSMNVDISPPEAYLWLKDQPGDFIVMEYPPPTDHSELLYQRVHGKRLFDPRRDGAEEFLSSLVEDVKGSEFQLLSKSVVEFPEVLGELGVKYVIFHKGREDPLKRLEDFVDWDGYQTAIELSNIIMYKVIGVR